MRGTRSCRALRCSLALLACALLHVPLAAAAPPIRREFPVPNSQVRAAVLDGNTLYIGGDFTRLGPVTGSGVPIDQGSGAPVGGFPRIVGDVASACADGAGGWFIGGDFTAVGEASRSGLAHVLADGSVATWDPSPDGPVQAMVRVGSTLYVGGLFGTISGQTRSQLAALDITTGTATPWNPGADGAIYALAASGNTIYVGGAFAHTGGATRGRIAALDATTGSATAWNPNALPDYSQVLAIAVAGNRVYASGNFISIGGQMRSGLAALDAVTGLASAWDPSPGPMFAFVQAIVPAGNTVYVGGSFATIGGNDRASLAALDAATGHATAWDPGTDGTVNALALNAGALYVGGAFTRAGGQERFRAAAIDTGTGAATAWDPDVNPVDATVSTLAIAGGKVFAGGTFASVGGVERHHVAAIDVLTGIPTAWNPDADNAVEALAVRAGTVYLGGDFLVVGGQPRAHVAAVDAGSGLVTPWDPSADRTVRALATDGVSVYAGGEFAEIGGQPRNFIAAVDPVSGAATNWAPGANGVVRALSLTGGSLYAGGLFTLIGGQTRNHIAALNTGSGGVTTWNPDANGWVGALALENGSVIAAGAFTGIGASGRNLVAALDVGNGHLLWPPEDPMLCTNSSADCLPGAEALAANGTTIFSGGRGQFGRGRLGGTDAASGLTLDWEPNPVGAVCALAVSESTLYVGGDFHTIAAVTQPFLAAIPLSSLPAVTGVIPGEPRAAQIALRRSSPNPSFGRITAAITLPDAATARLEVTDLAGRRILQREVGGLGAGNHTVELTEGRRLAPGVYLLRLTRGSESLTARAVIVR